MLLGLLLGHACREMMAPSRVELPISETITLYRSASRQTEQMTLEAYIIGVVAAEMPASFAPEALKAQAVCARTYTCHRMVNGYTYPNGANVSDDPGTCQAYVSETEFLTQHSNAQALYDKVIQAVAETAGEILLIHGKPLEALYHSTCGGRTEDAAALWGSEIPGIRATDCRWCQKSAYYRQELTFSNAAVTALLGSSDLSITEVTPNHRVKSVRCGSQVLSGSTVQKALKLPSLWFEAEPAADGWTFITHGYGHGMGLCQYGAGGMAAGGYRYREILDHYFDGAELGKL